MKNNSCLSSDRVPGVLHRGRNLLYSPIGSMKVHCICLAVLSICALNADCSAINVDLGTTLDSFAVLAGSTVTNTGPTIVNGDLGVSPGTAITGFFPTPLGPGIVNGTIHAGDATAAQAQSDLTTAYNFAAGETGGTNLTGQDLGTLLNPLTPGVYFFSSSAQLTGTLTLDAEGDPNAVFVFQIGSTLTTASNSSVVFINGGQNQGDNVFWQVGSSATLGTGTEFEGNILALTSITLDTGANIGCGRALASNGAVTMDTNQVSTDTLDCEAGGSAVPEPGTATLLGMGSMGLGLIAYGRYSRKRTFLLET